LVKVDIRRLGTPPRLPPNASDLRVEAFDTKTGQLLVSEYFDDPWDFILGGMIGGNQALHIRPDENGVFAVRGVEYKVVQRN
jgi:hypothetical protein